ncbi:MAG: hypothetical protein ACOYNS_13985 [Bacteroidota bacterium]
MTLLFSLFYVRARAVMLILMSVWALSMFAADTRSFDRRCGDEVVFAGEYSLQQHPEAETEPGDRQQEISILTRTFKPRSTQPVTVHYNAVPACAVHQPMIHRDEEAVQVKLQLCTAEQGRSVLQQHELQFQHALREQKLYSMNIIV